MKTYPKQMCRSRREFCVGIRKRVRLALKAAEVARFGCAYSPACQDITNAIDSLRTAVEKQKVKNWKD